MSFVPSEPGTIFKPENYLFYREVCPICKSALSEYVDKDPFNNKLVRICTLRPARKNILSSHQAKAHYFDTLTQVAGYGAMSGKVSYRQEDRIKQEETHPSKFLLLIQYNSKEKSAGSTYVSAKCNWRSVVVPGIWNPGELTRDNYSEIYHKAFRLTHFT